AVGCAVVALLTVLRRTVAAGGGDRRNAANVVRASGVVRAGSADRLLVEVLAVGEQAVRSRGGQPDEAVVVEGRADLADVGEALCESELLAREVFEAHHRVEVELASDRVAERLDAGRRRLERVDLDGHRAGLVRRFLACVADAAGARVDEAADLGGR